MALSLAALPPGYAMSGHALRRARHGAIRIDCDERPRINAYLCKIYD
ncbi:hypothetical protein D083_2655 [Dickeya solani RNS 08.23.3.1.A]|nr:hypothetical protein D083_2655 [Dickeya solani RNS 08.23.3.1.A]